MTGKTKIIGTRAQVWHGTCKKTSGGLTKSDLMMNKHGHIVSRAKHNTAKKEKRLLKYGYGTQKGKFGFVKIGSRKMRKGSKKMRKSMRGGDSSPADVNASYMLGDTAGQGITVGNAGSANIQLLAGMSGGRRRRSMRGGMYALEPADVNAMDITGQGVNSGNGIAGQGITLGDSGSANIQLLAGMSGGRRRRARGRGRAKGMMMMGGTTDASSMRMGYSGSNPQIMATSAGF
jgi:hypothetical protein